MALITVGYGKWEWRTWPWPGLTMVLIDEVYFSSLGLSGMETREVHWVLGIGRIFCNFHCGLSSSPWSQERLPALFMQTWWQNLDKQEDKEITILLILGVRQIQSIFQATFGFNNCPTKEKSIAQTESSIQRERIRKVEKVYSILWDLFVQKLA